MSWHFVERWLQKVNQHSTLIGKFWITFLIVFRIVVVSSIGDRVYSDEQSEFKCNTMQVGCPNICFNKFSPISHIRFWSFQIIMVTTPSIVFMVYSAHKIKKKTAKEKTSSNNSPVSPEKTQKPELALAATQWKNCPSDEDNNKKKNRRRKSQFNEAGLSAVEQPSVSRRAKKKEMTEEEKTGFSQHYALYTTSVLLRTFVEVFFILLQYKLFGFQIPELYRCSGFPCPNDVDCFVSRPMEKTIFLWFMFIIAIISFTLNVAEIYYLFWQYGLRKTRQQKQRRKLKVSMIDQMHDITIHDAEIVDGGIVAPRTAPPDYRGLTDEDYEHGDIIREIEFVREQPPMAMSVSLDDAMITEHLQTAIPNTKLVAATAPSRYRVPEIVTSVTSIDQPYANLKPDKKVGRTGKKGNDYYDYV
ncbi:gap junction delta-2 protein-like [Styela clava]